MLVKPNYNLLVLFVLRSGPTYGLAIKGKIDAALPSDEPLNLGSLYSIIKRHKEAGLVEEINIVKSEKGGAPRVYYQITEKGLDALEQVDKVIFALQ